MEIEDSIQSGHLCPARLAEVITRTEPLRVEDIIKYLRNCEGYLPLRSDEDEVFYTMAHEMIERRYSYLGAKDYLRLYIAVQCKKAFDANLFMESYVRLLCEIVGKYESTPRRKLELFVSLFYYHYIMAIPPEQKGKASWLCFMDGTWRLTDKANLRFMIGERLEVCKIWEAGKLNIRRLDVEAYLKTLPNNLDTSTTHDFLFYGKFTSLCDDKEVSFTLKCGSCYDIQRIIIRRGLPSDLATLLSGANTNHKAWQEKSAALHSKLIEWLSFDEVVESYLDVLGAAISEFQPRYAMVNSGSGADGKSSMVAAINHVFGGYAGICPATGPKMDQRSSGEVTHLANMLVNKRVAITSDAKDVVGLIRSPGFKSASGGDKSYVRKLYQEASEHAPKLKMLMIINTNEEHMTFSEVNELTRLYVIKFLNKMLTQDQRDLIPAQKVQQYRPGLLDYIKIFIAEFGDVFLTEIIVRHSRLALNSAQIRICKIMIDWTIEAVKPKTMSIFLSRCTVKVDPNKITEESDASTALVPVSFNPVEDEDYRLGRVRIESLYLAYMTWKKGGGGAMFSRTDPRDFETFVSQLSYFVTITRDGESAYVNGIRLLPMMDLATSIFPQLGPSNPQYGRMISGISDVETFRIPSDTFADLSIFSERK